MYSRSCVPQKRNDAKRGACFAIHRLGATRRGARPLAPALPSGSRLNREMHYEFLSGTGPARAHSRRNRHVDRRGVAGVWRGVVSSLSWRARGFANLAVAIPERPARRGRGWTRQAARAFVPREALAHADL